jgi:hypothetical protein
MFNIERKNPPRVKPGNYMLKPKGKITKVSEDITTLKDASLHGNVKTLKGVKLLCSSALDHTMIFQSCFMLQPFDAVVYSFTGGISRWVHEGWAENKLACSGREQWMLV